MIAMIRLLLNWKRYFNDTSRMTRNDFWFRANVMWRVCLHVILYTYHTFTRYPRKCNYLTFFYYQKKESVGTAHCQMLVWSKRAVRYKLGITESNDIKGRRGSSKIRAIEEEQGELSSEASIQQAGRSSSYVNSSHEPRRLEYSYKFLYRVFC